MNKLTIFSGLALLGTVSLVSVPTQPAIAEYPVKNTSPYRGNYRQPDILAQSTWPSGWYKQINKPAVYFVYEAGDAFCHVQNPSQLNVQNPQNRKIREVGDNSFQSAMKNLGPCVWNDGIYKRQSAAEVYRLSNGTICHISSPQMLEAFGGWGRVRTVEDSSKLSIGRKDTGSCIWPR